MAELKLPYLSNLLLTWVQVWQIVRIVCVCNVQIARVMEWSWGSHQTLANAEISRAPRIAILCNITGTEISRMDFDTD